MNDGAPAQPRQVKLVLLFALLIAGGLFFYFDLQRYLAVSTLRDHEDSLHAFYFARPVQTIAIYILGSILFVTLSLPAAAIVMMLGGAVFGVWLGTALCLVAINIGAACSLTLSRFVLRDFVRRRFAKQVAVVEREYGKNGVSYLVAMRLIPVLPYFVTNLVFGLTEIPLRKFVLVSLISSLPAVFIYANAGSELSKIHEISDVFSPTLIATFVALALLPIVGRWIVRRWNSARH